MKKMFLMAIVAAAAVSVSFGKLYPSEECGDARNEYKNNCIAQKCAYKSDKREKAKCEYDCGVESTQRIKCLGFDETLALRNVQKNNLKILENSKI